MTNTELRASLSLALVFFLRMLGIFLILPVFVIMADTLAHATPLLIGIALGCYGLTQAFFQIPFGLLSDRIGRKPVILTGLAIFILGSLMAASADSIYLVIVGRCLQGAGAIAAAVMALAADLVSEKYRSKTMALIGIGIGLAFAVAFVSGPVLSAKVNLSGLFLVSACLGILAILVLHTLVPDPLHREFHQDTETTPSLLGKSIKNRRLLPLYFSIMVLHMILMCSFLVIPVLLHKQIGLATQDHWQIYLPALLLSGIIIFPLLSIVESKKLHRPGIISAVLVMCLVQFSFAIFPPSLLKTGIIILMFFIAFNFMEASFPTLITRCAAASYRGTALGIYSTCQFFGIFSGGLLGGLISGAGDISNVFIFAGSISALWLVVLFIYLSFDTEQDFKLNLGKFSTDQEELIMQKLLAIDGVTDAILNADDGIAYLKVYQSILDYDALNEISMETV